MSYIFFKSEPFEIVKGGTSTDLEHHIVKRWELFIIFIIVAFTWCVVFCRPQGILSLVQDFFLIIQQDNN